MRITITLSDKDGGTEVVGVHEALPAGVSIVDNEAGWRMALGKLAALVEANQYPCCEAPASERTVACNHHGPG